MFARYQPGTTIPGVLRDLGNCPEFSLAVGGSRVKTYDSVGGRLVADNEFKIVSDVTGTIVTDDLSGFNREMWFSADSETRGNSFGSNFTKTAPLDNGEGIIVLDDVHVTNIRIVDSNQVPWIRDIDYSVDAANGIIYVRNYVVARAATSITVTYDRERAVHAEMDFDTREVEGELRFISYNPLGTKTHTIFPRVKLYPSGGFSFVGQHDTFATLGFDMTALMKPGERSLFKIVNAPVRVIQNALIFGSNHILGDTISFRPTVADGADVSIKAAVDGVDISRFINHEDNTVKVFRSGTLRLSTFTDTGFDAYHHYHEVEVGTLPTGITWGSADVTFSNNSANFGMN